MREFTDHLGRAVTLPQPPQRIVSLCPSITETLFGLGLDDAIVGVTRYCLHPADGVARTTRVGGTKRFRHQDVEALQPDLIVAEKEENRPEDIAALESKYPVYVVDVVDYASALRMIVDLGALCRRESVAQDMAAGIDARFQALPRLQRPLRVAYMIWRKPYMCAGGATYIDAILQRCGFDNAFRAHASGSRYPQLDAGELQGAGLDLLLLSSEPFPFKQAHADELAELLPDSEIRLVDGELFSWYGVRMRRAADYLHALIAGLNRCQQV